MKVAREFGATVIGLSDQSELKLAALIEKHDPHAETVRLLELAINTAEGYQKCVRLLEEASGQYVNSAAFWQLDTNVKAARAYLATLKGEKK